jgi:hypothetical protein
MSRLDISPQQLNLLLDRQGLSQAYAERKRPAALLINEFRAIQREKQVPHVKVQLRLIEPEKIELLLIKTARKYRDQGCGSLALRLLCILADRHRVTLIADACPADDCGLGLGDLMEWYGKESFFKDDNDDDCASWLTRVPETT